MSTGQTLDTCPKQLSVCQVCFMNHNTNLTDFLFPFMVRKVDIMIVHDRWQVLLHFLSITPVTVVHILHHFWHVFNMVGLKHNETQLNSSVKWGWWCTAHFSIKSIIIKAKHQRGFILEEGHIAAASNYITNCANADGNLGKIAARVWVLLYNYEYIKWSATFCLKQKCLGSSCLGPHLL